MKLSIQFLILALLISCQTQKKQESHDFSDLISEIDSIAAANRFNGVILISSDSSNVYSKAIGFSDIKNKTKIDINDQFVIGSISKQITAVLTLREVEKGKLELDDTIDQYLNGIDQAWKKEVSIHNLLTHTHGIVSLNEPLAFAPGSAFQYSQLGYDLLAQILESTTGNTFEKLSTELFETHKLFNTFHPDNKRYEHLVKGYVESENGALEFTTRSLDNYAAAGSFISNANDLKKWNEKLYSGQLVKKTTLKLMKTRYATRGHPIFETVEYGYGLLFKDGEQDIQIGALGYAPGFVSSCYYYPQTKLNLIVLENTANNLDDFRQTFMVHTKIMDLLKNQEPKQNSKNN